MLKRSTLTGIAYLVIVVFSVSGAQEMGRLEFSVSDSNSDQPTACRIHLRDAQGKPVTPPNLPFWRDHFVCDGNAKLDVPVGGYSYTIERGPEYRRIDGDVVVRTGESKSVSERFERLTHLRHSGWYSGDLHIHRPIEQVELLMDAEDLDFGPVITWWNRQNLWARREIPKQTIRRFSGSRFLNVMAGEDERGGGALLFFGLDRPLPITAAEREYPSPLEYVRQARNIDPSIWIDIEKPFWWDVPAWIASGQMNSIGIANNHMCHSSMYEDEAWGRPRDTTRLPNPLGNGYWTQEIYYHILNAGIRIPPSAGSASGVLPNPVGYNRVYVHLDQPFSPAAWWKGLAKSNCFVTNGPMLLVTANEKLHGSTLKSSEVDLKIETVSQDKLATIEIIQNGRVTKVISPTDEEKQSFSVSMKLDATSWILVRAITTNEKTFRFASTAPFFVQLDGQTDRISSTSCKYFADWVSERIDKIEQNVRDPKKRESVVAYQKRALEFWQKRMKEANTQ